MLSNRKARSDAALASGITPSRARLVCWCGGVACVRHASVTLEVSGFAGWQGVPNRIAEPADVRLFADLSWPCACANLLMVVFSSSDSATRLVRTRRLFWRFVMCRSWQMPIARPLEAVFMNPSLMTVGCTTSSPHSQTASTRPARLPCQPHSETGQARTASQRLVWSSAMLSLNVAPDC